MFTCNFAVPTEPIEEGLLLFPTVLHIALELIHGIYILSYEA